jgi:hypothetical protein
MGFLQFKILLQKENTIISHIIAITLLYVILFDQIGGNLKVKCQTGIESTF